MSYSKNHRRKARHSESYQGRDRYSNPYKKHYRESYEDMKQSERVKKPDYLTSAQHYECLFLNTAEIRPLLPESFQLAFYAAECYLKDLAWDLVPAKTWDGIFPARELRPSGLTGTHNIYQIALQLERASDDFIFSDQYARRLMDFFYRDRYPQPNWDRRSFKATEKDWNMALKCLDKVREACEHVRDMEILREQRLEEVVKDDIDEMDASFTYGHE